MAKRKLTKTKLIPFAVLAMLPASLCFGFNTLNLSRADDYSYISSYSENVTEDKISNASFEEGGTPYDKSNNLTGWTAIESESNANGCIINVGTGSTSDESTTNKTFSAYQNTVYFLENNPGSFVKDDSRILMINSKTSNDSKKNQQANKGYRSDTITLDANSYYSFSFAVKTATNGDDSVSASAYLSGLTDANGEIIEVGYENLQNYDWKSFEIYVATGDEAQEVTLNFYLGSNKNDYSTGAVFFDEVVLQQFSANEFAKNLDLKNYTEDNYQDLNSTETKFVVKDLLSEDEKIVDSSYNFNFENEINSSNTLGSAWTVSSKKNGEAQIMNLKNYASTFKATTGYEYVGLDLSYDLINDVENSQALVLYSKKDGYISIKSKSIDINPHQIYKITASIKVSTIESGSFTLGVEENDGIYTYHPSLENSSNSYSFQSGSTSGITSNTTNNYTNNYQTVELYVKGHSLYKSSFNIVLSLGNDSTNAKGCVVIDNITISNASYEEYSNATNKVEFTSYSSTNSNNSYFNETESENKDFPAKATGFTTEFGNEQESESGVVYLNTKSMYDEMYSGYDWAGIFPGNPNGTTSVNNVYMMYNNTATWQSISTSTDFSLTKNSYQKISFDLFTLSKSLINTANVNVEIVDENGIVLFKQSGIKSESKWNTIEIILHTAETVNSNITIKISLGDEDNLISGWAYIDNLLVSSSNETAYKNANYKNDFSDYFLSFESNELSGDVHQSTTTTAYQFSVDETFDGEEASNNYAVGGLVNGKENIYDIQNDLNLLVLTSKLPSTSSLKSVFTFDLESESYYKLTFDLKTYFSEDLDEENDYNYGASIGIEGFDIIKNLISNNKLTTYTIYLNSSSASTSNLIFSLTSDCKDTLGTALITNIELTKCEQVEFNAAKSNQFFGETVFQSNYQTADDDSTTDDDTTTDNDTNTDDPSNTTSPWLLIGSIVMGLAMIVAIIAYFLRKIKFKKKDKLEKSKYDRKISIDTELVANEAKKRRDEQLNQLFNAKNSLIKEKENLEETHKSYVKEARLSNKGKITKETEKEFKQYSANISKLEEKLSILEEQISQVSSPEYLIGIEKEVEQEEEYRIKIERKQLKERNKD